MHKTLEYNHILHSSKTRWINQVVVDRDLLNQNTL